MTTAISRLRKLAEAATPAPWQRDQPIGHRGIEAVMEDGAFDWVCSMQASNCPRWQDDARLIVAMRNSLPLLIDLVEAADRLRRALAVHNLYLYPCFDYDAKRAALDTEMSK